jgi:Uncharacterized protein conserved in bacteria
MKLKTFLSAICLFVVVSLLAQKADYSIRQVNLNQIELTDNFWLPKIRTIQEKTISYAFQKCEEEGRMENFVTAGDVIRGKAATTAKVRGKMPFDDTDVYKIIEGAAYSLINAPNPKLDNYLDSVIALIAYGQEADGYLTTWRTINPKTPPCNWVKHGGGRWFDLGMSHELYNAGHLFEAASAHFWATGKRNFLDIALKNADLLVKTFVTEPVVDLHLQVPGHQIVETGLIKLYQITGKEDYLKLSKQFLDNRGKNKTERKDYSQDHKPATEQDEVVGHAVRAVYMYAGMTDIAAIYGDEKYRAAVDNLWENMINKKMYITGGLGARHSGEAFGNNYELPNLTAYAETCAAIGGVYWAERMFRLSGNAKYINALERMLYNGVIAGISHSGTEFFYCNPLESDGAYKFNSGHLSRSAWFDCSCCPTNIIRFLPYVPNLIYAVKNNELYVNLFVANKAKISLEGNEINIEQKTAYPWNGKIEITVEPENQTGFTLKIRIPAWAQDYFDGDLYHYTNKKQKTFSIKVNGKTTSGELKNGYFEISKTWKKGDKITLDFPMEIREVEANPNVENNVGKIAIEYGTLIYCQEKPQNDKSAFPSFLNKNQTLKYKNSTFIPYYSWANRGVAEMKVWFEK